MKAIIIAGGLGTRLRPLTYNRPKPIVPMVNKPFVIHQIELLKKHGIKEIIVNLHYLSDSIEEFLGDGSRLGVKIYYSIEGSPLGTAGAVKNAEEFFDSEPMVAFNGDVLTDADISRLISFHKKNKAVATIALTRVEDPTPFGLVITDEKGRVKKFIEKPGWNSVSVSGNMINAGIYVLDPSIFASFGKGIKYSFERDLYPRLLEEGKPVYGISFDSYWLDIGSPKKYLEAHRDILRGEVKVSFDGKKNQNEVWICEGANISPSAKLRGPSIVGPHTRIAANARINPHSTIGDAVRISEGATIEDSVILRNSLIGKDVKLHDCIIGENCIIEDFAEIGEGVVLADYSIVKKGSKLA
ncbi:MAG: NDP-sugar synthase [Candidatus Margulisiibacteriota bacterium]